MSEEKSVEEPMEETVESPEKKPEVCVRCGWSSGKELEPLEADMKEYLRCILGGKEFFKSYEMYDGEVKLVFRSLNNGEVDRLNQVLYPLAGRQLTAVEQDLDIKLRLLFFLAELTLGAKKASYDIPEKITLEEVNDIFNERMLSCPETLVRTMTQTLMLFTELQGLLVRHGFDSNFWKGAGLR